MVEFVVSFVLVVRYIKTRHLKPRTQNHDVMRKSFFSSSYFDDLREESTHKLMVNDVEDERQQKNLEGDIKNPSRYSTKEVLMKQKRRIQKKQAKRADLADLFMGFAGLTKHVYVVRNKKNERTLWLHNENSINH